MMDPCGILVVAAIRETSIGVKWRRKNVVWTTFLVGNKNDEMSTNCVKNESRADVL